MSNNIIIAAFINLLIFLPMAASANSSAMNVNMALTETHLDHLRDDYNLWHLMSSESEQAKTFLSESITKKLIKLSVLASPPGEIRAPKLEVLCLLRIQPEVYQHHGHEDLSRLAGQYLSRVSDEVGEKIAQSQEALYGSGCYVTPN